MENTRRESLQTGEKETAGPKEHCKDIGSRSCCIIISVSWMRVEVGA